MCAGVHSAGYEVTSQWMGNPKHLYLCFSVAVGRSVCCVSVRQHNLIDM